PHYLLDENQASLLFLFGDTFKEARVGGSDWRSPVGLISNTKNLDEGIRFSSAAGSDPHYARQLILYDHETRIDNKLVKTILPTDAIVIDGKIYLHVMVCQDLGDVHWTEIYVSGDNGRTWHRTGKRIPGNKWNGQFQMITWASGGDGYIYVYSTSFRREKGILMFRVPRGKIADHDAYEPWGWKNNRWNWGKDPTEILTGRFGELNLRRVENKWVVTFFDAQKYRIDALVLDSPTADLFAAPRITVCRGGAWGQESDTVVPQLYGGYVIPRSTLKKCHLVISQWNTRVGWPYRSMQFVTNLTAGRD
ncbi:MAG: DUF4185 domain-containing protein, partial [Armatimonadota bacterium]